MPESNEIIDQIAEQNQRTLHYSRSKFLGTWFVVAILAVLTSIALIIAVNTAHRQNSATHEVALSADTTANAAKDSTENIILYLQGKQGIPGVPGANGKDGSPGQPSSQPGPQGPKGEKGAIGSSGSVGSSGPAGPAGAVGATGAAGAAGAIGAVGFAGVQGSEGPQGDVGPKGATGAAGAIGATGPAGPQGIPGVSKPISVQTISAVSPNDTIPEKQITATCPAGSVLIGGGYHFAPLSPFIVPVADEPNSANGWQVSAAESNGAVVGFWQMTVFALCATPAS